MNYQWVITEQNYDYIVFKLINNLTNQYASWKDVFEIYNNELFIDSIIKILSETNRFNEYYIEFNPTTFNQINVILFEFVLIRTGGFRINADIVTFGSDLLNTNSNEIIWFPNPSNTSLLITPCYNHLYPINDYIHIGKFMRSQNYLQKKNLIIKMFELYLKELAKQPNLKLWLSTHGKGVAWLHIRIDKTPKYISWIPYKSI